jgi:carbonic anhydrase
MHVPFRPLLLTLGFSALLGTSMLAQAATGPAKWGAMNSQFSRCALGHRQSPIDIRDDMVVPMPLTPIEFDYKSSAFGVIDTGRTLQINLEKGNHLELAGHSYKLIRVEFHHPAEERHNGKQASMGAHLIHQDEHGRTVIVAVPLESGAEQPIIQTVWQNWPLERGEEITAKAGIDLTHLLPSDRRYFLYKGSMTTPPCKESVTWVVMKNAVAISPEQLSVFARMYRNNARPVQHANGRLIKG